MPAARKRPAARTLEQREDEMILLAEKQAEQQLREGTAPAMVVTHYLKLTTRRERLERELLEENVKLKKAQTEAIASAKRTEELITEALAAFKSYKGADDAEEL